MTNLDAIVLDEGNLKKDQKELVKLYNDDESVLTLFQLEIISKLEFKDYIVLREQIEDDERVCPTCGEIKDKMKDECDSCYQPLWIP